MRHHIHGLAALVALALGNTAFAAADLRGALILDAPDLAKLELEDSKKIGGAYRYGIHVPVAGMALDAKSLAGGSWRTLKDGRVQWSRTLVAPGARSMDLHFDQLQLPTGATLELIGEGEGNKRLVRAEDLAGNGAFHSPYVLGETLRL